MNTGNTDITIDPFAAGLIRRKAAQLVRRFGFTAQDFDDLHAELFLRYWKRRHRFDPARGDLYGFTCAIIDQAVADLIQSRLAYLRLPRSLSLNVLVGTEDGRTELAQLIGPREQAAGRGRTPRNQPELHELSLDLRDFLETLSAEEQELARMLMGQDVSTIARNLGVPRTTIRSRVARLAERFEAAGFRDSFPFRSPV